MVLGLSRSKYAMIPQACGFVSKMHVGAGCVQSSSIWASQDDNGWLNEHGMETITTEVMLEQNVEAFTYFCSIVSNCSRYNFTWLHCWVLFSSQHFSQEGWIEIVTNDFLHWWVDLKMPCNKHCQSGRIWSRRDNSGGCFLPNCKLLNRLTHHWKMQELHRTYRHCNMMCDIGVELQTWEEDRCLLECSKDALVGLIKQ